jgi:hypothetical protein
MEMVFYPLLKSIGFHDSSLKIYEDYELRIRLTKTANVNYTLIPLTFVRTDFHNLSKSARELYRETQDYIFAKHKEDILKAFSGKEELINERMEFLRNRFIDSPQKKDGEGLIDKMKKVFKKG